MRVPRKTGSPPSTEKTISFRAVAEKIDALVRDFVELLDVDVHPGLIVLRESRLSRTEQWGRLKSAIEHVQDSGDPSYAALRACFLFGLGPGTSSPIPDKATGSRPGNSAKRDSCPPMAST